MRSKDKLQGCDYKLVKVKVLNEIIYGYDHGPFIADPKLHIIEEEGSGLLVACQASNIQRKFTS